MKLNLERVIRIIVQLMFTICQHPRLPKPHSDPHVEESTARHPREPQKRALIMLIGDFVISLVMVTEIRKKSETIEFVELMVAHPKFQVGSVCRYQ